MILLTFAAVVLARPSAPCDECDHNGGHQEHEAGNVCVGEQTVVCQGQGNGGLITLGNVLPGALGESCAAGDVYCCSHKDIKQVWSIACCLKFMGIGLTRALIAWPD